MFVLCAGKYTKFILYGQRSELEVSLMVRERQTYEIKTKHYGQHKSTLWTQCFVERYEDNTL